MLDLLLRKISKSSSTTCCSRKRCIRRRGRCHCSTCRRCRICHRHGCRCHRCRCRDRCVLGTRRRIDRVRTRVPRWNCGSSRSICIQSIVNKNSFGLVILTKSIHPHTKQFSRNHHDKFPTWGIRLRTARARWSICSRWNWHICTEQWACYQYLLKVFIPRENRLHPRLKDRNRSLGKPNAISKCSSPNHCSFMSCISWQINRPAQNTTFWKYCRKTPFTTKNFNYFVR